MAGIPAQWIAVANRLVHGLPFKVIAEGFLPGTKAGDLVTKEQLDAAAPAFYASAQVLITSSESVIKRFDGLVPYEDSVEEAELIDTPSVTYDVILTTNRGGFKDAVAISTDIVGEVTIVEGSDTTILVGETQAVITATWEPTEVGVSTLTITLTAGTDTWEGVLTLTVNPTE